MVTIGAYDGLHLGHRHVISDVCDRARSAGHLSALVTFDRHPGQVIRPESAPAADRPRPTLELLARTGIDYRRCDPFRRRRAPETAEDFVNEVLVECLNTKEVVVGEDFHFGHRRAGNVAKLRDMGSELGFEVQGYSLVGPTESRRATMPR